MPHNELISLARHALWLVMMLSAPPLAVAAIVGLVLAVLQAATQIQEQTLPYAAKFFALVCTLFFTASLLGGMLLSFTDSILGNLAGLVR
jgi:type III secretion protein S